MMMNNMKARELNEMEMDWVSGGIAPILVWERMNRMDKQRNQPEESKKVRIHGGGGSNGGW